MNEEQGGMLKSSCWVAAYTMQPPLTDEQHEEVDGLRRIMLSAPGEPQPCVNCPNEVWVWCAFQGNECEDFVDFADFQAYKGKLDNPIPEGMREVTSWELIKFGIQGCIRQFFDKILGKKGDKGNRRK